MSWQLTSSPPPGVTATSFSKSRDLYHILNFLNSDIVDGFELCLIYKHLCVYAFFCFSVCSLSLEVR